MIRLGRRGGVDKEDATAKPNAQHHVADYTLGCYGLLFILKASAGAPQPYLPLSRASIWSNFTLCSIIRA